MTWRCACHGLILTVRSQMSGRSLYSAYLLLPSVPVAWCEQALSAVLAAGVL